MRRSSNYVSFLRYFILHRIVHMERRELSIFPCKKTLLNISHHKDRFSKFPHTVLSSFIITTRVRLSLAENILITKFGACRSSKWANFSHIFLGRKLLGRFEILELQNWGTKSSYAK